MKSGDTMDRSTKDHLHHDSGSSIVDTRLSRFEFSNDDSLSGAAPPFKATTANQHHSYEREASSTCELSMGYCN
jgi:hypothetical protein